MTITSKYPGQCRRCGGKIHVGEKIEWSRGSGAQHLECPKIEGVESVDDLVSVGGGQGYGYRPYSEGQFVWHEDGRALIVVSTSKRYYREDGMSFGVGDEQGYVYSAKCRLATDDERQAALDRAYEQACKINLGYRIKDIAAIVNAGEYPTDEQPDGDRLFDSENIYGGGNWFVVSDAWIWYVCNNGGDGDNWENNNVRTGGAGAIGHRIPATPELVAELRALHAQGVKSIAA